MKTTVYKYVESSKAGGIIRTLKDGVDFNDYVDRLRAKGVKALKISKPSMATLERWSSDCICCAVDGCDGIELDGVCEHGFPSYLRAVGLI